jgi:hypothetical protein
MRLYYLEHPLADDDLAWVVETLEADVEQVQIPHILPAPDEHSTHEERFEMDEAAAGRALRAAGVLRDSGCRVALVIPGDMHWYAGLSEAIYALTGFYPFVVQTAEHRKGIGNPGYIRIIDMHGMMTGA